MAAPGAAQEPGRTYRVGFVGPYAAGMDWPILRGYQERMRELGWVEGVNLETTYRWAEGEFGRFPSLVDALMRTPPDILVLPCGPHLKTLRERAPDIPVVARCIDVEGFGGEIAGLGQAGRRAAGVTYFSPSAVARRLALLREALPHVSAIGLLHRRRSDWIAHLPAVEAAAAAAGFRTYRANWGPDQGFGVALDEAIARGARAFLTLGDGPTYNARHELFELATQRKVPILYDFPMFQAADELGLMAYYADIVPLFRRVAEQADAILGGGAPGALTLEEPRVFRFMVNLRAARALGLTLPDTLIQQADSVLK